MHGLYGQVVAKRTRKHRDFSRNVGYLSEARFLGLYQRRFLRPRRHFAAFFEIYDILSDGIFLLRLRLLVFSVERQQREQALADILTFASAIWVERYGPAGTVSFVLFRLEFRQNSARFNGRNSAKFNGQNFAKFNGQNSAAIPPNLTAEWTDERTEIPQKFSDQPDYLFNMFSRKWSRNFRRF